jgi:hypothetical protein
MKLARLFHFITALALLVMPTSNASEASAAPGDVSISWAGNEADAVTPNPGNELGAPDTKVTTISDFHFVWVRYFGPPTAYSGLGTLLGVSPGVLAKADVIAFEANGGHPAAGGGWESSTWFFSDLRRAYAETFDERAGEGTINGGRRARFWTGSFSDSNYKAYFCKADPSVCTGTDAVYSWILIDVPDDIDIHAPFFSVWVSGATLGEGSPDPDAIGIINR